MRDLYKLLSSLFLTILLVIISLPVSAQDAEARKSFVKGRFSLEDGRLLPAIEYFQESISLLQDKSSHQAGLIHYYLAMAYYQNKSFALASDHIDKAYDNLTDYSQAPLLSELTKQVNSKLSERDQKLSSILNSINEELVGVDGAINNIEFAGSVYNYNREAFWKLLPDVKEKPREFYPITFHLKKGQNLYIEKPTKIDPYYHNKLPQGTDFTLSKIYNYEDRKRFYDTNSKEVLTYIKLSNYLETGGIQDRSKNVTDSFSLDTYSENVWKHPIFTLFNTHYFSLGELLEEGKDNGRKFFRYEIITSDKDTLNLLIDASTLVPIQLEYSYQVEEQTYLLSYHYQNYETRKAITYPSLIETYLDGDHFQSIEIADVKPNSSTIDEYISQWNNLVKSLKK